MKYGLDQDQNQSIWFINNTFSKILDIVGVIDSIGCTDIKVDSDFLGKIKFILRSINRIERERVERKKF